MNKTAFIASMMILAGLTAEAATVSGRVQAIGRSRQADVITVVYATPLDGVRLQPGTFTLTQRQKTFLPRILPVPAGSTVRFPNEDQVFHNVFSMARPNPFDLGLYRAGATRSQVFGNPGVQRIFCNIHPQMIAIVLVLPTSYFVQADAGGAYRIDLPAGRYRITAWSERAQPVNSEITVAAAPVILADMTLNESGFVEAPHRNKFGLDYVSVAYDPLRDRKPR